VRRNRKAAGRVTWRDALLFWGKVVLVCLVLGVISFYIGRNYLGTLIAESEIREGAPELVIQAQGTPGAAKPTEPTPPQKLEVTIEEREASGTEAMQAAREMGLATDDRYGSDGNTSSAPSLSDDADIPASDSSRGSSDQTDRMPQADRAQQGNGDEDGRFVVVAGSFANPANSEAMLKELQSKGYRPYITRVTVGDKTYSRVNIGAFPSRAQADKLGQELTRAGYEVTVGVR
jgi:cell division septation protein DedD